MRIGLDTIDPVIAEAMATLLCAPSAQFLHPAIQWKSGDAPSFQLRALTRAPKGKPGRPPSREERIAYDLRRRRERFLNRRILLILSVPLCVGGIVGIALSFLNVPYLAWGGALTVGGALVALGILWTLPILPRRMLNYEVLIEEMKAVFPLLTLSPIERAYCDTLLQVAEQEPNQEARHMVRSAVKKLSALVECGRRLEKRRQRSKRPSGSEVAAQLDAQEAAVVQAFKTVQAALLRMQVAPSPETEEAALEIAALVKEVSQQTVAVEQTVEEEMKSRVESKA